MLKIYHYSNVNFKGYIKPSYFGLNKYTHNSQVLSNIKRIYFYSTPGIKEVHLQYSKYLYIAKINKEKLYNIDSNKIISSDIYKAVKEAGYIGLYNSEQVVLFYKVKILKKIDLTY
jgi:hypothetical protein